MERAKPESLTEADYYRALKNVQRTKKLIEGGKTPEDLIKDTLELISRARHPERNSR